MISTLFASRPLARLFPASQLCWRSATTERRRMLLLAASLQRKKGLCYSIQSYSSTYIIGFDFTWGETLNHLITSAKCATPLTVPESTVSTNSSKRQGGGSPNVLLLRCSFSTRMPQVSESNPSPEAPHISPKNARREGAGDPVLDGGTLAELS